MVLASSEAEAGYATVPDPNHVLHRCLSSSVEISPKNVFVTRRIYRMHLARQERPAQLH